MELYQIVLMSMAVIGVRCDSHSLRYLYTAVSAPGFGLPTFTSVGFVDDQQIDFYSSDTGRVRPVAPWMNNEDQEYWDRQTRISKAAELVLVHNVKTAMDRFNQTGGIHTYQRMYGCELRDDGTTNGYNNYGYDGRGFIHLDTKNAIYYSLINEAQMTVQRVNSPEVKAGEIRKHYLENICISALKRYMEYGRESLEKRVRPEVKVWGRPQSNGVTRLQCLVYGFHPQLVDVKWVRNGIDDVPSDEMSPILPHPDGTYQIRVSAEVPIREGDTFSCHVDHSSLGSETLSVKWENGRSRTVFIASFCTFALFLAVAVVGIFIYKKWGNGYRTTRTSDNHSDTSNRPRA